MDLRGAWKAILSHRKNRTCGYETVWLLWRFLALNILSRLCKFQGLKVVGFRGKVLTATT